MAKSLTSKKNRKEIFYHIINSLLAGLLVLLGSFADGDLSWKGFLFALFASAVIAIQKFKDYWDSEKSEYMNKIGTFF